MKYYILGMLTGVTLVLVAQNLLSEEGGGLYYDLKNIVSDSEDTE